MALAGVLATFIAMFFVSSTMLTSVSVGLGFFALITVLYFAGVNKGVQTSEDAFDEVRAVTSQIPAASKKS